LGALVALDQRHVAVEDSGIHHGIAAHLQRIMFAGAEHVRRHADGMAAGLQCLDRRTGGDAAHYRYRNRMVAVILGTHGGAAHPAKRALDHARGEAATAVAIAVPRQLGELDDFNGAGAIGQPANEAALLERGDEAMNPGLRTQIQRVLHLVEGGRDTGFLQPFIDETEKFVLFAREHFRPVPRLAASFDSETSEPQTFAPDSDLQASTFETNHEQTLYVRYVFRNHLISSERDRVSWARRARRTQNGSRRMSHGEPAAAGGANGGRITSARAAARFPSSELS